MMRREAVQARMDELLSAYMDGELDQREWALLEARLTSEPELRARLEALRQTVSLVGALPQVQAPRNFILTPSMVRADRPRSGPRRWLAPALTFATGAVGLLCVVVLMTGLLGDGRSAGVPYAAVEEPSLAEERGLPTLQVELVEVPEAAAEEPGAALVSVPTAGPTPCPEAVPDREGGPWLEGTIPPAPSDAAAGGGGEGGDEPATEVSPAADLGEEVAPTAVTPQSFSAGTPVPCPEAVADLPGEPPAGGAVPTPTSTLTAQLAGTPVPCPVAVPDRPGGPPLEGTIPPAPSESATQPTVSGVPDYVQESPAAVPLPTEPALVAVSTSSPTPVASQARPPSLSAAWLFGVAGLFLLTVALATAAALLWRARRR